MTTETIEVFYKDTNIDSADGDDYYHKYIVYTDSNGDKFYARGGPSWFADGKLAKLETEYGAYVDDPSVKDWDSGNDDPSELIKSGSDLSSDWQSIIDAMDDINDENWSYWPDRNSNSVVDTALDRAGLPLPTQDDSGEYLSPGSGNILDEEVQTPPVPQPKPDWVGDALAPFDAGPIVFSPLVVDLDSDDVIELTTFNESTTTTYFDLYGDGFARQTAWVSGDDGLLARDVDQNGVIDDITELFGSATVDGFALLAELDTNGDLVIDANDDNWSDLLIWQDSNSNAVSETGELHALDSLGIVSISLADVAPSTSTINGNPISHTSTFKYDDGSTDTIVDAWFVHDKTNTFSTADYAIDETLFLLPTLRGFGQLPDLHLSITENSTLKSMLQDFVSGWDFDVFADPSALNGSISGILYEWAGVASVDPDSRGSTIDARHLEFLEEFFGKEFSWLNFSPVVGDVAGVELEDSWAQVFSQLKAQLLIQLGADSFFEYPVTYNVLTGDFEGDTTLSESAIDGLVAYATASGVDGEEYWAEVARFLDVVKGFDNFSGTEDGWMNDAIYDTDPSLTWDDIKDLVTYVPADLTVTGTSGDDTLDGGTGNDSIYGKEGNDILSGHAGGDNIYGGSGNDTYVYESGDDYYHESTGTDVIELPAGIDENDLSFGRVNSTDLLIQVGDLGTIQIQQFFYSSIYLIESLKFDDESTFDLTDLPSVTTHGTEGNDSLEGYSSYGSVDDIFYGYGGDDGINALAGDDWIDGGAGNDTLIGGTGNDTYIASAGYDQIYDEGESATATIIVPEEYGASDVTMFRSIDGVYPSLNIFITGLGQIRFHSFFEYWNDDLQSELQFANGTDSAIDLDTAAYLTIGTSGNDTIYGITYNGSVNDTIDGGDGDDNLQAGAGDDTYIFSEGSDLVIEASGTDTIAFGAGIAPEDIEIYRSGITGYSTFTHLIFEDANGNTLSVLNQYQSSTYAVESIEFEDQTTINPLTAQIETRGTSGNDDINLTYATIGNLNDIIYGYDGNDTINGAAGNDLIYAGSGNDTVYGASGDDVFYFSAGLDTISDTSGTDTLWITGGVTINDVTVSDLYTYSAKVVVNASTDEITLSNVRFSSSDEIETIKFDDGFYADLPSYNSWLKGTSGNDTVSGTSSDEVLIGYDGNDQISGGGGADHAHGGDGDDTLDGGAGADLLYGGADDDTLIGGDGDDVMDGGAGTDIVDYSSDTAGVSVNLATGTATDGSSDTDTLSNIENVLGSDQADTITGDANANDLDGGAGNDTLIGGAGDDALTGGSGTDTIDYSGAAAGIVVDLASNETTDDGDGGTDTLSGIENVIGSAFDDTIAGDSNANVLSGGAGNDTILGAASNDTLYGGADDDVLWGNLGDDAIYGDSGSDTVSYSLSLSGAITVDLAAGTASGEGSDTLTSIENVIGSIYGDVIDGDSSANVLNGGAGADNIDGAGGDDTLIGGAGNDTLTGGTGSDTVDYSGATSAVTVNLTTGTVNNDGQGGTDTLSGIENVIGSDYNDTITGNIYVNYIDGGSGNDIILGGASGDTILGGDGNDLITGNTGNDTIDGGNGSDTIDYSLSAAGIIISLITGTAVGDGSDTLSNFENVNGSTFADLITGDVNANYLAGNGGADIIFGKEGDDIITGGNGNDQIDGGSGADDLYGGAGADTFFFFDATAFDAVDTIEDFDISTDDDVIDISDILDNTSYEHGVDPITDWVEITTSGSDSVVKVDVTGTGSFGAGTQIAILEGITGLTDEAALVTSGNLLAA